MITPTTGVLTVPERLKQGSLLADRISSELFSDNRHNHWEAARTAWLGLAVYAERTGNDWCMLVEDDAVPAVDGPLRFAAPPARGIVSLYLGSGDPIYWQKPVAAAVERAEQENACWIHTRRVLHGVAIAMPTEWVRPMFEPQRAGCHARTPYDETVSARNRNRDVWYAWPSLVDHADGPSVLHTSKERPRPRKAFRVGQPDWNHGTVVEL